MINTSDSPPATIDASDPLAIAVEAARLLGRWSLIAQKHEAGCSCCPGLGDVAVADVEQQILKDLRARNPSIGDTATVAELLRSLVMRSSGQPAAAVPALLSDIDRIIGILEQMQRGW